MPRRALAWLPRPCVGRRGCTRRDHQARGLCNACYKHYQARQQLDRFPLTRHHVTPTERYRDWVASGMRVSDYAAYVGVPRSSLSRSLRAERERLTRLGLPYLDGYRRLQRDY